MSRQDPVDGRETHVYRDIAREMSPAGVAGTGREQHGKSLNWSDFRSPSQE